MTIIEFLLARILEDEVQAHNVLVTRLSRTTHAVERVAIPERVLAECAAKRAIIELAESAGRIDDALCDAVGGYSYIEDRLLFAIAAVYRDHPDFREGWAL